MARKASRPGPADTMSGMMSEMMQGQRMMPKGYHMMPGGTMMAGSEMKPRRRAKSAPKQQPSKRTGKGKPRGA